MCGVYSIKTLSNASIEPSLLQRHLQTNHPNKKARDPNYFKRPGENAKKQRLDKTDKQYQQSVGIVTASYKTALLVEKNKQPHTIAEELIMPAAKVLVKHVIGNEAVSKLNSVLMSNNTMQRCITEMSTGIKEQVITEVLGSKYMDLPYHRRVKPRTACGLCALSLSRLLGYICPADFLKLSFSTNASRSCLVQADFRRL